MIYTSGNSIVSVFTGGVPVKAVYTYGSLVWSNTFGSYYIKWTPEISSGTFTIGGITYNFSDYTSAFRESSWNGVITAEAFEWNSDIQTLYTNATEVRLNAFSNCHSLSSVTMTECTYVGAYAFYSCDSLRTIEMSKCKEVYQHAFEGARYVQNLSLPDVEFIGSNVFGHMSSLYSLYVGSKCSEIGDRAFFNCGIQTTDTSKCKITIEYPWSFPSFGSNVFNESRTTPVTSFFVPCNLYTEYRTWWSSHYPSANATFISRMFVMGNNYWSVYTSTNLTGSRVSWLGSVITNAKSITNTFGSAWTHLREITFLYPQVMNAASNALQYYSNTSIYVPSSLVSDYETAQYWSVASGHFFPITSLPINN